MFPKKQFVMPRDLAKVPTIKEIKKQYRVGERTARAIRSIVQSLCYAEA